MKKITFIKAALMCLSSLAFCNTVMADDDDSAPQPVNLKTILPTGTLLPHAPTRPVTNLLGIDGHNLYVYPTGEAQMAAITLRDENDVEVFSTTLLLTSNVETVALPANLIGTYTIYYNVGDSNYMGWIEL